MLKHTYELIVNFHSAVVTQVNKLSFIVNNVKLLRKRLLQITAQTQHPIFCVKVTGFARSQRKIVDRYRSSSVPLICSTLHNVCFRATSYIHTVYKIDRFIQSLIVFHILLSAKSFLIFQKIFHSITKS
jgi:hypothetical protein